MMSLKIILYSFKSNSNFWRFFSKSELSKMVFNLSVIKHLPLLNISSSVSWLGLVYSTPNLKFTDPSCSSSSSKSCQVFRRLLIFQALVISRIILYFYLLDFRRKYLFWTFLQLIHCREITEITQKHATINCHNMQNTPSYALI